MGQASDEEPLDEKKDNGDQDSHQNPEGETDEANSSNTDCDQDSEVSFMDDTDEDTDTPEIEEEEWNQYIKRSTKESVEKMEAANVLCWIENQRKMKWQLVMGIA